MQSIVLLQLAEKCRKQQSLNCTSAKPNEFLNLTGKLTWLGYGVLLQAAFSASHLQQSIGRLTVSQIVTANKVIAELKSLVPKAFML